MTEITFGTPDTPPNEGGEPVINDPAITDDGKNTTITVSPEQAEAVRKMLAEDGEKKEEVKADHLGGFKTHEELESAYKELRTKMSAGDTKKEVAPADSTPKAGKVEEDAKKAGVSIDKYVEEWGANKALTEDSYKELEASGFTKEVVDNYIAGRIAVVAEESKSLIEAVGSQEDYDVLLAWGKVNLPEESQQAYDRLLNVADYDAAKLVLRGFVQQYEAAEGGTPKAINAAGVGAATTAAQPFGSRTDMTDAINDRRYKSGDKLYVKSVEARIIATEKAGRL